jgi:hypothetical protein
VYDSYSTDPRPRNLYLPAGVAGPKAATQSALEAFTPPAGKPGTPPSSGSRRMSRYHVLDPSSMATPTARTRLIN